MLLLAGCTLLAGTALAAAILASNSSGGAGNSSFNVLSLAVLALGTGALSASFAKSHLARRGDARMTIAPEPAVVAPVATATPAAPRRAPKPAPQPRRPAPAPEPPSPQAEPAALALERPRPARLVQADIEPATSDEPWQACRIRVRTDQSGTRFYAVPLEAGPVLAESPEFWLDRRSAGDAAAARAALAALTSSLTAAGWVVTGRGRQPWDLELRRGDAKPARRRAC